MSQSIYLFSFIFAFYSVVQVITWLPKAAKQVSLVEVPLLAVKGTCVMLP